MKNALYAIADGDSNLGLRHTAGRAIQKANTEAAYIRELLKMAKTSLGD